MVLVMLLSVIAVVALGPSPVPTTYADGLVVRLTSLERLPAADGAACDAMGACRPGAAVGEVVVRVNVGLGLPAAAPAPIALDLVAGTAGGISLFAGAEHRAAAIDCGFVGETAVLCTDSAVTVPSRVEPGGEVTVSETFDVPAESIGTLVVTVQPPVSDRSGANPLRTATFTDAQTLLTD